MFVVTMYGRACVVVISMGVGVGDDDDRPADCVELKVRAGRRGKLGN